MEEAQTAEPFKFVGQLVVMHKDTEGKIIGEEAVAQITLYAGYFEQLPAKVAEAFAEWERQRAERAVLAHPPLTPHPSHPGS